MQVIHYEVTVTVTNGPALDDHDINEVGQLLTEAVLDLKWDGVEIDVREQP